MLLLRVHLDATRRCRKPASRVHGKDSPFVVHRPIRAKIIAYSTSKNQINTVKINKLYEPRVAKVEILTY